MARRSGRTYMIPPITFGGDKPLPETRKDSLDRHLPQLEAKGVHQIQYSNGEFISSSLLMSKTEAGAKDRTKDLECADSVYYLDPTLKIYWRRTGSFD